jgi:hypothetical protein
MSDVIDAMLASIHPGLCSSDMYVTTDNPMRKPVRLRVDPASGFVQATLRTNWINPKWYAMNGLTGWDGRGANKSFRVLLAMRDFSFMVGDPYWYRPFSDDGKTPGAKLLQTIEHILSN